MIKLITKLGSVLVKASAMVTLMCVTTIAYSLEIKHAIGDNHPFQNSKSCYCP